MSHKRMTRSDCEERLKEINTEIESLCREAQNLRFLFRRSIDVDEHYADLAIILDYINDFNLSLDYVIDVVNKDLIRKRNLSNIEAS